MARSKSPHMTRRTPQRARSQPAGLVEIPVVALVDQRIEQVEDPFGECFDCCLVEPVLAEGEQLPLRALVESDRSRRPDSLECPDDLAGVTRRAESRKKSLAGLPRNRRPLQERSCSRSE
jgi:hypothetical protein